MNNEEAGRGRGKSKAARDDELEGYYYYPLVVSYPESEYPSVVVDCHHNMAAGSTESIHPVETSPMSSPACEDRHSPAAQSAERGFSEESSFQPTTNKQKPTK